ncbi:MAG: right-handed parallel beta-helix repeat-containing protein [Planctomycetes bacterium]|nr:right-handed parallel beta-helix repeat-containing protein [Planctomycetota bacterium]
MLPSWTRQWWLVVTALLAVVSTAAGQGRHLKVPGDHSTIESAILAAAAGDVIEVAAGLYRENITLKAGVTLRGKSAKTTIVHGDYAAPVLTIVDADKATVARMTFEHSKPDKPQKTGDAAILIEAKGATLQDIHVRNGVGPGIRVDGGSVVMEKVDVRSCAGAGVWVLGARSEIRSSVFAFNSGSGIRVEKGSELVAKKVSVESNTGTGIDVDGEGASVRLEDITARQNGDRGIRVAGAAAHILRPQLIANGTEGLVANDSPRFDVVGGSLKGNGRGGLWMGNGTIATITGIACIGNETYGVTVRGEGTQAVLSKITATDNKAHGIMISSQAKAEVEDCICARNAWAGISGTGKGTEVTFTSNTCNENVMHGLSVAKEATGTLTDNVAENNKLNGITVVAKARVKLVKNRANENEMHGLQVREAGTAELERNTFDKNDKSGIEVRGRGSEIKLKRNRCRRNLEYGVRFVDGAAGFKIGRDNEISKNRKGRVRMR